MILDTKGISQYLVYVHEHREIIPDLTKPYGLFTQKPAGPKIPGIMEAKSFLIKDNLYKTLPREDLKCLSVDNGNMKEPSYEGGIGKCIESKIKDSFI